jgi:hypothetical protein
VHDALSRTDVRLSALHGAVGSAAEQVAGGTEPWVTRQPAPPRKIIVECDPGPGLVGAAPTLTGTTRVSRVRSTGCSAGVGAENPVTLCDLHVFVDEAAEPVAS